MENVVVSKEDIEVELDETKATECHQFSSSFQEIETMLEENIKQTVDQRNFDEENENLRKQLENSNVKLAEMTAEFEKFKAKEEDLKSELQLMLNEVEVGKQSNQILQSEYSKLNEQHLVLTEANKSLTLKNESFESRQLVLIEEKDHLLCKYEDLKKEMDMSKITEASFKDKIQNLLEQNKLLKNEKYVEKNEFETSKQHYQEQIEMIKSVSEETIASLTNANNERETLKIDMEKERQEKKEETVRLKLELEHFRAVVATSILDKENQKKLLGEEINSLRHELEKKKDYEEWVNLYHQNQLTIKQLREELKNKNDDDVFASVETDLPSMKPEERQQPDESSFVPIIMNNGFSKEESAEESSSGTDFEVFIDMPDTTSAIRVDIPKSTEDQNDRKYPSVEKKINGNEQPHDQKLQEITSVPIMIINDLCNDVYGLVKDQEEKITIDENEKITKDLTAERSEASFEDVRKETVVPSNREQEVSIKIEVLKSCEKNIENPAQVELRFDANEPTFSEETFKTELFKPLEEILPDEIDEKPDDKNGIEEVEAPINLTETETESKNEMEATETDINNRTVEQNKDDSKPESEEKIESIQIQEHYELKDEPNTDGKFENPKPDYDQLDVVDVLISTSLEVVLTTPAFFPDSAEVKIEMKTEGSFNPTEIEIEANKTKEHSIPPTVDTEVEIEENTIEQPSNPFTVQDNTEVEIEDKTTKELFNTSNVQDNNEVEIEEKTTKDPSKPFSVQDNTEADIKAKTTEDPSNPSNVPYITDNTEVKTESISDEDGDSLVSIEMTTDENEKPNERNFKEDKHCSKNESLDDGNNGDLFQIIINDLIDSVTGMEKYKV